MTISILCHQKILAVILITTDPWPHESSKQQFIVYFFLVIKYFHNKLQSKTKNPSWNPNNSLESQFNQFGFTFSKNACLIIAAL